MRPTASSIRPSVTPSGSSATTGTSRPSSPSGRRAGLPRGPRPRLAGRQPRRGRRHGGRTSGGATRPRRHGQGVVRRSRRRARSCGDGGRGPCQPRRRRGRGRASAGGRLDRPDRRPPRRPRRRRRPDGGHPGRWPGHVRHRRPPLVARVSPAAPHRRPLDRPAAGGVVANRQRGGGVVRRRQRRVDGRHRARPRCRPMAGRSASCRPGSRTRTAPSRPCAAGPTTNRLR